MRQSLRRPFLPLGGPTMKSRPTLDYSHPNAGAIARLSELVHIALRNTFFLVGPIHVFGIALLIGAAFEGVIELAAWDSSFFQNHSWCPFVEGI